MTTLVLTVCVHLCHQSAASSRSGFWSYSSGVPNTTHHRRGTWWGGSPLSSESFNTLETQVLVSVSLRGAGQHSIHDRPCPRHGGHRNNDADKGARRSRCLPFILFHTNKNGDREIRAQLTVTSKVLSLNPDPDILTPGWVFG